MLQVGWNTFQVPKSSRPGEIRTGAWPITSPPKGSDAARALLEASVGAVVGACGTRAPSRCCRATFLSSSLDPFLLQTVSPASGQSARQTSL